MTKEVETGKNFMTDISDGAIIRQYIAFRDAVEAEGKILSEGDPAAADLLAQIDGGLDVDIGWLIDVVRPILEKRARGTKPLVEGMQLLEGAMAIRLREQGIESIKCEHGTVYQSRTLTVKTADKEALFNYIRESDDFHLLAANLSKDAVKDFMTEHQEQPPPGVDVAYITKTLFRRA